MSLAAGGRLGPYEIIAPLGSGGMGEVYRARDTRLGRDVAIKVLPAERVADEHRRARFVQEARAASALNHPHIVAVYDIASAEGTDFIVMELVPGKTLDALIPRHGMRLGEVLRVAIPLADALAAAHGAGIVHRDLKPANVMVTPEGVVKVLDFGLAKLTQAEEGSSEDTTTLDARAQLSHPGTVAGTPAYMSPEQASGGKVDARSDVFTFGAVLYEMVTGRRPFGGGSTAEILASLLKEQPKPPSEVAPDVPKELERITLRCLRKEPARRFQHMTDLKVELEEVKEESDSQAMAPSAPARRRRGRWVAAGVVGAVALAVGSLLVWGSRPPVATPPHLVALTAATGFEEDATFSPDGDHIAYAWNGEKGDNLDIYVKIIGSTESLRLTTDPASDSRPAWSPDGRRIAFVRLPAMGGPATIHVVSPLGGSERMLSEQPVAGGQLSWSPDGRWVATGADPYANAVRSAMRGIRLVDSTDGAVREITSPRELEYHTAPALSPDGRHLAYLSCRGTLSCRVEVVELGLDWVPKGETRPLTTSTVWPRGLAWTRDGEEVVYGGGSAWRLSRVRIDGGGPPQWIEIAGFGAFRPAIAVSRDRLAFMRVVGGTEIARFEPGRPPGIVASSSSTDRLPHVSPDGRRFAFESQRAGGWSEIWVADVDGSKPTQLTHSPGLWQGSPCWSPDGRRIAFDSFGEDGQWDIWTIDAEGGPPRRLTSDPADETLPSWSRDGRFVYFASSRSGTDAIWRVPVAGGPDEQVTRAGNGRSQESGDGKTLLVQRRGRGPSPLVAVALPGGGERTVLECVPRFGFAVAATGIFHLGCGRDAGGAPLSLLDSESGRDRLVGTLQSPSEGLAVSADGKTVLYTKIRSLGSDLVLIENFR